MPRGVQGRVWTLVSHQAEPNPNPKRNTSQLCDFGEWSTNFLVCVINIEFCSFLFGCGLSKGQRYLFLVPGPEHPNSTRTRAVSEALSD